MSGGSYDYTYGKIYQMADDLRVTTPLRKAFKAHLRKVAKACHDIEWVDSCDYADGDEEEAIRDCLGKYSPSLALKEIIAEAVKIKSELENALEEAMK